MTDVRIRLHTPQMIPHNRENNESNWRPNIPAPVTLYIIIGRRILRKVVELSIWNSNSRNLFIKACMTYNITEAKSYGISHTKT